MRFGNPAMPLHDTVKFLLVDDLEENLMALEALLRRDGLDLFTAKSGAEALELLLQHEFALALLDVQMMGMDGFELAELMRGTERTRRVPIIFLTAVATDEKRRFRGHEAGAVDYLLKPLDPQLLANKANVFFELGCQRQELARQRDELRTTADQLSSALSRLQAHGNNSPLALVEFDPDYCLRAWSQGAERMFGWRAGEVVGLQAAELPWTGRDAGSALPVFTAEMIAAGEVRTVHAGHAYRKDGTVVTCEWYSSALLDGAGRLVSISSQILDVTERKRAEETQQLLIGELNHRVKNMLATVQAIANQTLRYAPDPATFAADFSGRLQALARVHSLLSEGTWKGARLAGLISDQLSLGTIDGHRLTASGPELWLAPQQALHLALILHELSTNANKYGALSVPHGQVSLDWTIEDSRLRLRWTEHGGPAVSAPSRRGFGTALIEQSARAESGAAHVSYRSEGIAWEIELALPEDRMAAPAAPAIAAAAPADMPPPPPVPRPIAGRRFLVVEDEPMVALEVATALQDAGAKVVGPVGTVEDGLDLIERIQLDGALLDGNLHGEPVDALAAALTRRKVPFMFVTGYGRETLPQAFGAALILGKPFSSVDLVEAATQLVRPSGSVVPLRQQLPVSRSS